MLDIFLNLTGQITPLLVLVLLGFISGKYLGVNLHSLAIIAIYIIAPYVNFGAIIQLEFQTDYFVLPIYMFVVAASIGCLMHFIGSYFISGKQANLISMSSVTGNTGYFGLPIVLYLLGPEWVGVYLFMNLGMFLIEISLGYFFGARGEADVKGAVIKMLKLPVIYAIILGLIANNMNVELPETLVKYWDYFLGTWIVIGMMLIGTALSKQEKLELDVRLTLWMLFPRFILWPLMGFLFVLIDVMFFQIFNIEIYTLVIIFVSVPLAGNVVAFASSLNLYPEKAAATVLFSTILSMVFLPLMLWLLGVVI